VARLLTAAVEQEESTWSNVMAPVSASSMLSGRARAVGFSAVSKAAESACVRFFVTVRELLDRHRQVLRSRVAATATDWEDRVRQMKARATTRGVVLLLSPPLLALLPLDLPLLLRCRRAHLRVSTLRDVCGTECVLCSVLCALCRATTTTSERVFQ
jgi:hypothetical protein